MDNDSPTSGDAEIVEQVVAGDVHAFEHLLRKYQNHVVILLKKHLPYDLSITADIQRGEQLQAVAVNNCRENLL
jgi:hypothetical protein